MELREKIARALSEVPDQRGHYSVVETVSQRDYAQADAILDIPEIKEALRSQCSSCDGARGPLLCTECVRDFIKAE